MASVSISALWSSLLHDFGCNNPLLLAGVNIDLESREVSEPVGCTGRQFAAVALLRSIASKFQDEIDQEFADKAAFLVFHEANAACQNWRLRTEELGPFDEELVGEFKKLVYDFFNPEGMPLLDFADILPYVDFGPGSAPGADSCDFITKIGESQLTASNQLLISLYDSWLRDHNSRIDCELARSIALGPPVIVKAARISAVPKKRLISRLVKPEPLLNMFFQKGIAEVLRQRLFRFFGISLTSQPQINAELARVGSNTGKFATIDLKSASDYLALDMCRWCIPRSSLLWLLATRSEMAESDRGVVPLHMMATMGNDFCFPLQTAIFACAVLAAYRALGLKILTGERGLSLIRNVETGEVETLSENRILPNFGVFGDDIIVLDDAYPVVVRLLRALGFIPNQEKSFWSRTGSFRESCGSDWLNGFNVRGVYCKSLKTIQDRYALINNLVDWSSRTGISLPDTISLLRCTVPDVVVPPWENPDSGLRVPERCIRPEHKVFKCNKAHRGLELHGSYLYKRYVPTAKFRPCSWEEVEDSDDLVPTEGCFWNSTAVFLAAIKGHCRGGRISLRQWETPYRKRLGVAPCWDYISPKDSRDDYRQRWFSLATAYFSD